MPRPLPPPYADPTRVDALLRDHGHVALSPQGLGALLGPGADPDDPLAPIAPFWSDLPPDEHLRDGGGYRRRRHGSFVVEGQGQAVTAVPHRPHWQPVDYNALHGGISRWFDPLQEELTAHPVLHRLVESLTRCAATLRQHDGPWFVEAHVIRITTEGGIGRPTPEGAHRDGVDLVAVLLLGRQGITGGETRVFEADGPRGQRFTMNERGTALLIDDERTIHESTPIQPVDREGHGHRDTLVLTWRRGGFQAPS